MRTVICRQERIGLHMADASYSRLSSGKKIGVFSMRHGSRLGKRFRRRRASLRRVVADPGAASGYERRIMNWHPNFSSSQAMRPVTKWAEPLTMGEAVPEVMRRAFFQVRNGRPGPVLVEIPRDVFDEEVPQPWEHVPSYSTRTAPDPDAVEAAAAVLAVAERPVIYARQGGTTPRPGTNSRPSPRPGASRYRRALKERARSRKPMPSPSVPAVAPTRGLSRGSSPKRTSSSASGAASRSPCSACGCRRAKPSSTPRWTRWT